MNELWTWALIASLILLAVSASINTAQTLVTVKGLENQISALREQIELINKQQNEESNKQREIHTREKNEFTKLINNLTSQITYLKSHSVPLTLDIDSRQTYEYQEAFNEAIKDNQNKTS
jgi:competence protein ComGC